MTIGVNDTLSHHHTSYNLCCAIITVYLIGCHIFFILLPSCFCEWISLDVHPHNQHIQMIQTS